MEDKKLAFIGVFGILMILAIVVIGLFVLGIAFIVIGSIMQKRTRHKKFPLILKIIGYIITITFASIFITFIIINILLRF